MKRMPAILLLLIASVAHAQNPVATITKEQLANIPPSPAMIVVDPIETEPFTPITAVLDTEIPEGATVFGDGWVIPDGVKTIQINSKRHHVWAKPGEHTIAYKGVWVHYEEIEILDAEGNKRTIKNLLGMGMVDTSTTFTVLGEEEEEEEEVTPGDLAWAIIVEEKSDRTKLPAKQRLVFESKELRDLVPPAQFLVIDDDSTKSTDKPYIDKAKNLKLLPALFLMDADGEELFAGDVPGTVDEAATLIRKYGGGR
jgi:hypothetical protein